MLRLITCQNATMLLEQQADQPVPKLLGVSLWLHLRYCPCCNRYAKQTVLIAEWVRILATARTTVVPFLSEAAKKRMRERLTAVG